MSACTALNEMKIAKVPIGPNPFDIRILREAIWSLSPYEWVPIVTKDIAMYIMEIQIAPKNKLMEISLAGLLNSSANGVIISHPTNEKKIITEEAPTEDHPFGTNGVKELNFT